VGGRGREGERESHGCEYRSDNQKKIASERERNKVKGRERGSGFKWGKGKGTGRGKKRGRLTFAGLEETQ